MCENIIAPVDVDVDKYFEEIQQGPNLITTQSCYVFQQSHCELNSAMEIQTIPGDYSRDSCKVNKTSNKFSTTKTKTKK